MEYPKRRPKKPEPVGRGYRLAWASIPEAKILQNSSVVINQLPVEILVMIISLAIPNRPLVKIPYRCVRFSSVCHHWRLVVLNHAAFWKSIIIDQCTTRPLFGELRSRSRTTPSEVMVRYWGPEIHSFRDILFLGIGYANTLYVEPRTDNTDYSNLLPFFFHLENIFCHPSCSQNSLDFETLTNHTHTLKALQATVIYTESLEMAKFFQELRWLNLTYLDLLTPGEILKSLESLPNLQVLYLRPKPSRQTRDQDGRPYCNAARIEGANFGTLSGHAPHQCSQTYIYRCPCLRYSISRGTQFCGFDFSRITHICAMIGPGDPYIMGKTTSEDIPPFTFNISRDARGEIFDLVPTSYSNRFHFTYASTTRSNKLNTKRFMACLKEATSLVEIVLNEFVIRGDDVYADVFPFFDMLAGATTVCHLNILSGGDFYMLCYILGNGMICPNLERLTYSSNYEEMQCTTSYLHLCLQKLMEERSMKPLEVEIKGFDRVQPEELEQIEKLGLRLIQKEREETHIFFEKEDYFEEYD